MVKLESLSCVGATMAVLIGMGLAGCGSQNSPSDLKDHATVGGEVAKIVKVERENPERSGETEIVFGLVSGKAGSQRLYYLECLASGTRDYAEIQNMTQELGFGGNIKDLPAIVELSPEGDELLRGWQAGSQPVLSCKSKEEGATLRKVIYPDNSTKYFFTFPNQREGDKRILFHAGCDKLPRILGFDPASASQVLYSNLAEDFNFSDGYDIHCIKGSPVGQGISWEQGKSETLDVKPGDTLPTILFTAKDPLGNYSPLTTKVDGVGCAWLQEIKAGPSILYQGTVPQNFSNKTCQITVKAAAGQAIEDAKTVVIRNRVTPKLASDCPAEQKIESLGGFQHCEVKSTRGKVEIKSQTCPEYFMYNAVTQKLILTIMPAWGSSCSVSLVGRADDLMSLTTQDVKVTAECPADTRLTNGKCELITCENKYRPGDTWPEDVENGSRINTCSANGVVTPGPITCKTGYNLNNLGKCTAVPAQPTCPPGKVREGNACVTPSLPCWQDPRRPWVCLPFDLADVMSCPLGEKYDYFKKRCVRMTQADCRSGEWFDGRVCQPG
jgi:hypothetical protein